MPTGTNGNDNYDGTSGDDEYFALGGDDYINGTPGTDHLDGGSGFDRLGFQINEGSYRYPDINTDVTYTLTNTQFFDSEDRINTTYTSIEGLSFYIYGPEGEYSAIFDASGLDSSHGAESVSITLNTQTNPDVMHTVIGSALDDYISVIGSNVFIDSGDGYDVVSVDGVAEGDPWYIETTGDTTTVSHDWGAPSLQTFLTIINAEMVEIGGFAGTGSATVDASGSGLPVQFRDGFGSDTFIGSNGDDRFIGPVIGIDNGRPDTYFGGSGADFYYFFGGLNMESTTIADFSPDDAIYILDHNLYNLHPTVFIGTGDFTGTAGEYRYYAFGGQTFVEFDGDGDGVADGTLTISNGEFELEQVTNPSGAHGLQIQTTIRGTAGDDTIDGTGASEKIYTFGGNDTVHGLGGHDLIFGSGGDDALYGDGGNDTLNAGAGNDAAYGDSDNDVLRGQGGDDLLRGGTGDDDLFGGVDDDTLYGDGGNDRLFGNGGEDFANGGNGDDNVFGGGAYDRLYGGAGNDLVNGQSGDDFLVGGTGIDLIVGGFGADRFVFADGDFGPDLSATDRIKDFTHSQADLIDLTRVDANAASAGDQAFAWIGNAAFSGTAGELRYNWSGNTTVITGDTNGDGTADFALWLTGQIGLVASDFEL